MIIHVEFDTNLIKLTNSTQNNNNGSKSDSNGIKQKTFKDTLNLQNKNNVKSTKEKATNSKNVLDKNTASEKEVVDSEDVQDTNIEEIIEMLSAIVDLLQVPQITDNNTVTINTNNTDIVEETLEVVSVNVGELFTDLGQTFNDTVSNSQISEISSSLTFGQGETETKVDNNNLKEVLNELINAVNNVDTPIEETTLLDIKDILNKLKDNISKNPEVVVDTETLNKASETVDEKLSSIINDKNVTSNKEEISLPISSRTVENINNSKDSSIKQNDVKETNIKNNVSNEQQSQTKTVEKSILEKEDKFLKQVLGTDNEDDSKMNSFSLFTRTTVNENSNISKVNDTNVINKDSMVKDVVKNIKYMDVNGVKELVVKIKPKELGEISIRLIQDDGVMKANIKASSKETYSLLSQNLNDIKKYLQDQNIKIQDVELGLYSDDTTFFKDGEFDNNSFDNNAFNGNHQSFRGNQGSKNATDVNNEALDYENEAEDSSNINMLA